MNAEQLIENYVTDVIRRLPRGQRADVGVELRDLLWEELAGRTAENGEPTEADTMALLTSFGRPADVAARYRPTFTIIDPADSRTFLRASLIGVGLIWLIGLLDAFQHGAESFSDGLLIAQEFYFRVGLPALIWPGFLVVWFGLAAWARRRWPRTAVWKPRPAERDGINRFGTASAIAFFVAGTAVLVNPGRALDLVSGGRMSDAGFAAFAYTDEFLRIRGPLVLAVIVAGLVLLTIVLIRGRWEPATRRTQLVMNVASGAILLWVLLGGRAFEQPATDDGFKAGIALTLLLILVDLVIRIRRRWRRLPAAVDSQLS